MSLESQEIQFDEVLLRFFNSRKEGHDCTPDYHVFGVV